MRPVRAIDEPVGIMEPAKSLLTPCATPEPASSPKELVLDYQARLFEELMEGEILHCPLEPMQAKRLLRIGCSTDGSSSFLARRFPDAEVYSLYQTLTQSINAPERNMYFLRGDIMTQGPNDWRGRDPKTQLLDNNADFDLTFSRLFVSGIDDWSKLLRTSFALLRPSGWSEVHAVDISLFDENDESLEKQAEWMAQVDRWSARRGIDLRCGSNMAGWMLSAGYVNISTRVYRLPIGGEEESEQHMKDLGDFWWKSVSAVFDAMLRAAANLFETDAAELARLIAEKDEAVRPGSGRHMKLYVTYAQRPE